MQNATGGRGWKMRQTIAGATVHTRRKSVKDCFFRKVLKIKK